MKPFWQFSLPGLGAALGLTILLSFLLPVLFAWLIAINLVTLVLYRYDKIIAGSAKTRVPEIVLLLAEAVGGTIGAAIAMWAIRPRHKTRSVDFVLKFILVLAGQLASIVFALRVIGNF